MFAISGVFACSKKKGGSSGGSTDLSELKPENIRQGITIGGVTGTLSVAPDLSNLKPENIVAGVTIGGITGTAEKAPDATTLDPASIPAGVTIGGVTGTLTTCSADGATNCLTTSRFKAVDTNSLTTWDIRKGKSAGGISGSITFYKNMADTAVFDRTAGSGAATGLDVYYTIDDQNNGNTPPTQNNAGWDQPNFANWVRDSLSDDGAGGGTAGNGACDGGEDCVYKDMLTGILWARSDATQRTWEAAITYCENLDYGGYDDWRLPTQKEMQNAMINGINSLKDATKLNLVNDFWSSTTLLIVPTQAFMVALSYGTTINYVKTNTYRVACGR